MYDNSIFSIFGGMLIGGIILILLIVLTIGIIYIIGLWKLFKKAGYNGWEAIIPFYNSWILIEISGLHNWYFLLLISNTICSILEVSILSTICSLVSLVTSFFMYYNISKKFEKDILTAILTTIFPYVMIPIIGFSNNFQFNKNITVNPNGPINENNNYTNYTTNNNFCKYCGNKLENNANFCKHCGKKINENE